METLKKPRITPDEQKHFKAIFEGREDLLTLIRDLFFGFTLSENEKDELKRTFESSETKRLIRKMFLPSLERGIPIGESLDLWMLVPVGPDEKTNKFNISVRSRIIQMFENALALMDNVDGNVVQLGVEKNGIALMARATYVANLEARLNDIWVMAHKKEETDDERILRLAQDSMK